MIDDIWLSPHFKLSEFLRSDSAARNDIDMTPSDAIVANLRRLCTTVLEPVRDIVGQPMIVSSGYRPPALNKLVGGVSTSAHVDGRAADIIFGRMGPTDVMQQLKKSPIATVVDQAIDEFEEWVHLGIEVTGDHPRGQFLIARRTNGKTVYLAF